MCYRKTEEELERKTFVGRRAHKIRQKRTNLPFILSFQVHRATFTFQTAFPAHSIPDPPFRNKTEPAETTAAPTADFSGLFPTSPALFALAPEKARPGAPPRVIPDEPRPVLPGF